MKVLVTGGAGFIGSHLVERLVVEGHEVDVVDDLSTGRLANLAVARADQSGDLRVHTLDVRAGELDQLVQRRRPDVVVHLASPGPGAALVDRFSVVAGGLVNVLASCRRHGVARVVTVASSHLYGAVSAKALPMSEQLPRAPHSLAAASEVAALDMLAAAREVDQIEFVALVLANVYGPRSRHGVVARLARAVATGEAFVVDGGGEQTRDFVYVDDVVDALARSLSRGSGVTVNIGSGTETSVARLVAMCGSTVAIDTGPPRPQARTRVVLDVGRAAVHLGWKPFTPLVDGLGATLAIPPAP